MADKPRFRYDHLTHRLVPIQELPEGKARGSNEFSNRGLGEEYNEITVWPKTLHYRLTTGDSQRHYMGRPEPVQLDQQEKWICTVLGLAEWELGIFLRSWQTNANGGDSSYNAMKRPETLEQFKKALTVSGKNREIEKENKHEH